MNKFKKIFSDITFLVFNMLAFVLSGFIDGEMKKHLMYGSILFSFILIFYLYNRMKDKNIIYHTRASLFIMLSMIVGLIYISLIALSILKYWKIFTVFYVVLLISFIIWGYFNIKQKTGKYLQYFIDNKIFDIEKGVVQESEMWDFYKIKNKEEFKPIKYIWLFGIAYNLSAILALIFGRVEDFGINKVVVTAYILQIISVYMVSVIGEFVFKIKFYYEWEKKLGKKLKAVYKE